MKELIIKLILFFTLLTPLNSQWIVQESVTDANLTKVQFLNEYKGFVAASPNSNNKGKILMTENSGLDWEVVYEGDSQTFINDIRFFNESDGIAVGMVGYPIMGSPIKGLVLVTNDGGNSWNRVQDTMFSRVALLTVSFYKSNHIVISGGKQKSNFYTGFIATSTDGGLTWTDASPKIEFLGTLFHSQFTSENDLYILSAEFVDGEFVRKLYRSDNNMQSWQEIETPMTILSFDFYSKNVGMICGEKDNKPALFRTNNGGASWTEMNLPEQENGMLRTVKMMDNNTAIAIGNDMQGNPLIAFTKNSGVTWTYQSGNFTDDNRFSDVSFAYRPQMLFADFAYIVGESGLIMKSIISENPAAIVISKSYDFSYFSADVGTVSETKSFKVMYKNVFEQLNLMAPEHFELSIEENGNFTKILKLDNVNPDGELEIFVRFKPESIGEHSGNFLLKNYTTTILKLSLSGTADNTSGVDDNEMNYVLYPNPTSDFITIQLSNKGLQPFVKEDSPSNKRA